MLNNFFITALHSRELLLIIILISLIVKTYLLKLLIPSGFKKLTIKYQFFFLLGTLIGTFFGDIAWIMKLMREMRLLPIQYSSLILFIRISWGFSILQYQSFSFFLESLITQTFRFSLRHRIFLSISLCIAGYFFYIALFDRNFTSFISRSAALHLPLWSPEIPLEIKMMNVIIYFSLFFLMIPSAFITLRKSHKTELPTIIQHQLPILLKYFIGSFLSVLLIQAINFLFCCQNAYIYPIISIATLILSYAIYYSITTVLGIRFLNTHNHVQSTLNINIINEFKNVLEQLSHATTIQEVSQIVQVFFKDAFNIPFRKTQLYIRPSTLDEKQSGSSEQSPQSIVEQFIQRHCPDVCEYMQQEKILIYDELNFSNFYQPNGNRELLIHFLQSINADIFLPIYDKKRISAYIIIDIHMRKKKLYGDIERDEMIIFAGYLSNIINLLQNRTLPFLMRHEKKLQDELHLHKEEIKQYKECLRSFIHNRKKQIGVIFYKNRRFTFGNQAAKELIHINLNAQDGHYLTQICRQTVHKVAEYKTAQTVLTMDELGNKLVLLAVPNLEQNNIILIVHPPEMNDIMYKQTNILRDPAKWDYLLYLETTKAGQLIHQLIPGNGELLTDFKINLLQAILSRKTLLLKMSRDDLLPTIELLHHLSNSEALHIISPEQAMFTDNSSKKAGSDTQNNTIHELITQQLRKNGTVVIKDIDMLTLEVQELILDYIKYGYFLPYNDEQLIKSNARVIMTSDKNLSQLAQEGTFSKELYKEIHNNTLDLPAVEDLSQNEIYSLIDGLTEQAIKTADFKKMLNLTEKEKINLIHSKPKSLQDLRVKLELLLIKKSKKNNIFQETCFDPAYHITDPELADAARLGKHALRDAKTMGILWNKFHNQNKIASFLGVNRSSVNRRCQQYNLH